MKKEEFPKLDKKFKTKWMKALRSGEYKQGFGTLKEELDGIVKYCCLGVAGEISGVKNLHTCGTLAKGCNLKGISKIPSPIVGDIGNNILVNKLVTMNDSGKYSFKRIATWIEKNL